MRRFHGSSAFLLALSIALSGCSDLFVSGGGRKPAELKAFSPADGAEGLSVLSHVSASFSRKIEPTSLPQGVRLFDGGRQLLVGHDLKEAGETLTMAPGDPLDFGTTYRVEITKSLGFGNGSFFPQTQSWEFTTEGTVPPALDPSRLMEDLGVLAHDSMEGRDSGSDDELRAAQYIASRFKANGLQEPPGGFIQGFSAYAYRFDRFINSQNVLGSVPGSGTLADEWLVVGAHYDHIGYRDLPNTLGGPNNGADDNGSGTVVVTELARIYREWVDGGGVGSRDRRSVLFALFGAEEQGLLGSCSYLFEGPAVPIQNTVAMMNFDMVGRLRDNTIYISGVDASAGMGPLVTNANTPDLNLSIRDPSCSGCTDHACFWRAGVPFVGFFTGTHGEYHKPGDDVELMNVPGMVKVGDLGLRILGRLAVMPNPPGLTTPHPSAYQY